MNVNYFVILLLQFSVLRDLYGIKLFLLGCSYYVKLKVIVNYEEELVDNINGKISYFRNFRQQNDNLKDIIWFFKILKEIKENLEIILKEQDNMKIIISRFKSELNRMFIN